MTPEEKARKWLEAASPAVVMEIRERWVAVNLPSLIALLQEMRAGEYLCPDCGTLTICAPDQYKAEIVAEVRRVVEERLAYGRENFGADWTGADLAWLLARLEKI